MGFIKGLIWSLLCFGVILFVLISIGGCTEMKENKKDLEIFKEGIKLGMDLHIDYLFNQLETCEVVPLNLGNTTVRIIDLNCIGDDDAR